MANLPIALYFGMKIGQISFFKMTSPVERPYGSRELGSKYQGQSTPTASQFYRDFDGRSRRDVTKGGPRPRVINETVDWSARPGRWRRAIALDPGGHRSRPTPGTRLRAGAADHVAAAGRGGARARRTRSPRRSTACWSRRRPAACWSRPASASAWTSITARSGE